MSNVVGARSGHSLPAPYLLFLGDLTNPAYAKTAFGLKDWAADKCVGEFALPGALVSTGLPSMTPGQAKAAGARSMVIGVANEGGYIAAGWIPGLLAALEAGLDLVSGMHMRLGEIVELRDAADRLGRQLIDIRTPPTKLPIGTGRKRSGKRLLTVGTDCALGKKYTALTLTNALQARGLIADFRATGQTGIMIAGGGIPMDAVVSDFLSGAAETLSPDAAEDHWDVIEGQGSLHHPGFAGVSLGLLHGSQPDCFVVCHHPGRTEILGLPGTKLPSIEGVIDLTIRLGSRVNSAIRCAGVSFNTSAFSDEQAEAVLQAESARLGLPVADPIRGGPRLGLLVDAIVQ